MARLTLVATAKSQNLTHRGAPNEGESARRLLESQGYMVRREASSQFEFHACPFHEEAGPAKRGAGTNFYMNKITSQYYCMSARCMERGNLRTLERFYGLDASDPTYVSLNTRLEQYEASLAKELRQPFYNQGLDDTTIERFRLGYDAKNGRYVIPYLVEGRRPSTFRYYNPSAGVRPDGTKELKYYWEKGGEARLFNAQDAVGDPDKKIVILAEGEIKTMLLCQMGYAAVGVPGASVFKREWVADFAEATKVVVLFDNDNPEHPSNIYDDCKKCPTGACGGHNPGQEAAHKVSLLFSYRAKNVVLPLPSADARKTDINEYIIRDGHSKSEFAYLALGVKDTHKVASFAEILENPPDETGWMVDGLLPSEGRLLVTGAPKSGKAGRVSTPALTPHGWTTMGELRVGDEVIGVDGQSVAVLQIHPQGTQAIYRVTMSDGSWTDCTWEHLWHVQSQDGSGADNVTTEVVAEMLAEGRGRETYIPMVAPVQYAPADPLPLDPYTLGIVLADGQPIIGKELGPQATKALQELDLWGYSSRFVPEAYLRASVADRHLLLQGMFDVAGWMEPGPGAMVCLRLLPDERFRRDVQELVESLGGTLQPWSDDRATWWVQLPPQFEPFGWGTHNRTEWMRARPGVPPQRRIVAVDYIEDDEAVCITVDSTDGLYVTERFIVTHNSLWVQNLVLSMTTGVPFLRRFAVDHPTRVLLLDRELSRRSLFDRFNALVADRPGLKAGFENLLLDHDHNIKLDRAGALETLIQLVEQNGVETIVLDTAYKFFSSDMESSTNVAKALDTLDQLIKATQVSVVLTHHHRKGSSKGNEEQAHPDQVVGSFLWTGWPNGTVLLNFSKDRVADPFTTICSFAAFRDAAPPEPLVLHRTRESIAYQAISDYVPEEDRGGQRTVSRERPSVDGVADLLFEVAPVIESDFLHMAGGVFSCNQSTIKLLLLDLLDRSQDFIRTGTGHPNSPYVIKVNSALAQEETWEEGQGGLLQPVNQLKLV